MEVYKPGTMIDDQYEVVSLPMMGGMGTVYFCLDHKNEFQGQTFLYVGEL